MRRLGAIVLAAGLGERFGGPKQIAELEGRPLVLHALGAIEAARPRGARIDEVVVVLGHRAEEVERLLPPAGLRIARNPDPSRGLASSLKVGLAALGPGIEGALVFLADQPRVSAATIEAVADAWATHADTLVVVPRYAGGDGRNPALVDRRAWTLALALEGDRGMSAILDSEPGLALEVDVPGANPDVDTPSDLAGLSAS